MLAALLLSIHVALAVAFVGGATRLLKQERHMTPPNKV
jgi:hypothetical protein